MPKDQIDTLANVEGGLFVGQLARQPEPSNAANVEAKAVSSRRHISQLDGLRAFAIFPVLLAHGGIDYIHSTSFQKLSNFGNFGVQLFFILSGYLITGILLASRERPNYFLNFYARRGLRIWPLYYVVLLVFLLIDWLSPKSIPMDAKVSIWPYIGYIQNLVYGHRKVPAPLGPTWSLAVEEQFYLVWPLMVRWMSRKNLVRICLIVIFAVPIIRATQVFDSWNTICQLDSLMIGAFLAMNKDKMVQWNRIANYLVILLPIGLLLQFFTQGSYIDQLSVPKTAEIYGCAMLFMLTMKDRSLFARFFNWATFRYIGTVSYGVYLLNVLVFSAIRKTRVSAFVVDRAFLPMEWGFFLIECAVVVALASLSFYFFEKPFLRLKQHFAEAKVNAT